MPSNQAIDKLVIPGTTVLRIESIGTDHPVDVILPGT